MKKWSVVWVSILIILLGTLVLFSCYKDINTSDDSGLDTNVPTKSVSSWDNKTDFSKMAAEEIVEYARTHPKGFNLENKELIPCAVSPRGPESDPYSDMIPYDTDLEPANGSLLLSKRECLLVAMNN